MNTLRHLFLALGGGNLEAAFRRHAGDLNARPAAETLRTVALDGKTLRGSFDHLTDCKAVHVLSAFASDAALILAHQELAGAPDEVAAVPRLMAELGLTGVLFTADALHCQKDAFAQAAATGAWFRIRPFWVTQGVRKRPACEGRILVGRVFCAGGGEPPRVKLAGAEAVPG